MNVLLVTIIDNNNLGNRLQHYALQKEIENLGCKIYNAVYQKDLPPGNPLKHLAKKMLYRFGIKKYWSRIIVQSERIKKLQAFTDTNIKNQIETDYDKAFSQNWSSIDCAVVGSDQVWHNWGDQFRTAPGKDLDYYYLRFLPANKRIAYAPSFGFSEFPDEDKEIHKTGLEEMLFLSCREKEGCALIKKMTGKDAEWVLDPTLLLEKKDWDSIAKKPSYDVPEKYVLLYFLGAITDEYQAKINEISEKFQLEAVNVNAPENFPIYFKTAPDEFVYLLSHADFVCTDSFHAAAFSIIYGKNFIAFRRRQEGFLDMFGRIDDLLSEAGLANHEYKKDVIPDHDVESASDRLGEKRKASINYLKRALNYF